MRNEPPAVFTHTPPVGSADHQFDPLQLCIYTTIGILAWLLTPAAIVAAFGTIGVVAYARARRKGLAKSVAAFGTIGVVAYARARRKGLAKSRCKLGDTRLVIAYLAVAGTIGIAVTAVRLANLLT
jgi:hypothetical protein